MRKYEKKRKRSEKVQSSIKRSKVCLCQEKLIYFRSEHSNTWGVLNFRAIKEINFFFFGGGGGLLKKEVKFSLKFPWVVIL